MIANPPHDALRTLPHRPARSTPPTMRRARRQDGRRGPSEQRGALVLVAALGLVAAASIATAVSMRTSGVQERLTQNHMLQQQAVSDAESLVASFASALGVWNAALDTENPPSWMTEASGNIDAQRSALGEELVRFLTNECGACGAEFAWDSNAHRLRATLPRSFPGGASSVHRDLNRWLTSWRIGQANSTSLTLPIEIGVDPPTAAEAPPSAYIIVTFTGQSAGAIDRAATSTIRAKLSLLPEGEFSSAPTTLGPFDGGLIACNGFTMSGSGEIDSFDSRNGLYGVGNRHLNQVRLTTLTQNASGSLSGGSNLRGDLVFTGAQLDMTGSGAIRGNVTARGNVSRTGDALIGGTLRAGGNVIHQGPQGGDIIAGGNVTVNSGRIDGTIQAGGNINFTSSANYHGGLVRAVGNVTIDSTSNPPKQGIRAGGLITPPSWWSPQNQPWMTDYLSNQNVSAPPAIDGFLPRDQDCDVLGIRGPSGAPGAMFTDASSVALKGPDIRQAFKARRQDGSSRPLPPDMIEIDGQGNVRLKGANLRPGNPPEWNGGWEWQDRLTLGQPGQRTVIEVGRNFTIDGSIAADGLRIEGDVVMVVRGDFNLGPNQRPVIAPGASLTILVEGKTTLSAGTSLLGGEQNFVIGEGENRRARMAIYSAYQSQNPNDAGVTIAGGNTSNVAIYAPHAKVNVTAGGTLYGAVRARFLEVSGGAPIRYDVALADLGSAGSGSNAEQHLTLEKLETKLTLVREFYPER